MATSMWIKFNLPLSSNSGAGAGPCPGEANVEGNTSPASLGHRKTGSDCIGGGSEISPSNCVSVGEGNLRASLVITEEDLPVSRGGPVESGVVSGPPDSERDHPQRQERSRPSSHPARPDSLYRRRSSSSYSVTSSLASRNEPLSVSRTSTITRALKVDSGSDLEGGHREGEKMGYARVVANAQGPCRVSGENSKLDVVGTHLPDNVQSISQKQNTIKQSALQRNSLHTFYSSDSPCNSPAPSLDAFPHLLRSRTSFSTLASIRPVSPPSTWCRQLHIIDQDGNPYSDAMFRRPHTSPSSSAAAPTASFAFPDDQSPPHRPPRSKLRKPQPPSNHPYAARTLQPSFNHLNAILPSNTRPTSILRDSAVIDLTDANSSSSWSRVTVNGNTHPPPSASRPSTRRPSHLSHPSDSTNVSSTSGSSTNYTASYTSTALTTPSLMTDHRKVYPTPPSGPSVVLTHPVSNSLSPDHPLPPLPSPTQAQPQNVSCFSRTSVQALTSVLGSKASPSRKLTKRRTLSGSTHTVVLDRPLPPPPPPPQPAADAKDTSTKGDHQRTRRSRSILGVRIPMVTDSSKKRSSDIAEARPPVPRVPTQEPLEPGSKSLPDPYAQAVEPPTPSTATIYTPFSAAASPNSPTSSSPPHASHNIIHKRTPSGALSELAFTGATALSSSALAHLTSRLSLREDHSPEKTALPIYSSNPNDHNSVFDPYAVSQQPLPDSFLDHAVSEDGYTIGCAAAFDVSSVFRRRSHKGESGGKMRAQTLHVSASATFVRAERHNTPPQRTSPTHHQITRPLALSTSGSGSSGGAAGSGAGGWSGGWNENDGASMTMRRWTLALTDVSDEVLVQELEKIRKEGRERERERKKSGTGTGNGGGSESGHGQGRGRRMSRVGSSPKPDDYIFGGPTINGTAAVGTATSAVDDRSSRDQAQVARAQSQKQRKKFSIEDEGRSVGGSESDEDLPPGVANGAMTEEGLDDANDDEEDPSTEDEDAGWKTARRALLCCRELVRTERTYQARLRQLLQGDVQFDTQNPTVPSLILSYLPPLLLASEAFLSRLEDDPSAWGVSAALLACEEEIEGAFVAWCEVVGELFVDSPESTPTSPKKLVRKTTVSTSECSGTESRSRVASTFGGRGRTRSVVSVTSSASHSHESSGVHRPRATTSYIPNHSPYPPPPPIPLSPPVFPPIRGHPYNPAGPQGMFTAALGTGLAWGLSPHSTEKSGLLDKSAPRVVTSLSSPISPSTSNGGATSATTSPNSTSQALSAPHSRSGSSTGLGRTFSAWRRKSFTASLPSGLQMTPSSPTTSSGHGHGHRERKPTVRELAIQPTQRVMRYVLQYRDLLDHTPMSSPSRPLVERALESALRIAEKCDKAQSNSAFFTP